ncbi:MAG: hypothetical protein ACUVRZ_00830 [Desulfobacca sp.]|uniref:hypothetical protein n=1 Tax=Desulfobacca sp. TaxID=2067990 RepID=UPI0040496356
MQPATLEYMQEEQRRRGSVPRLKAEVRPFDVDCSLGPGVGTFVNSASPAPGVLLIAPGAVGTAGWTSEILQAYAGRITAVTPTSTMGVDYCSSTFWLRSCDRYEAVAEQPWVAVAWDATSPIASYFQVKIECADFIRAWAVDEVGEADDYTAYATATGRDTYDSWAVAGAYPGLLEDVRLTGSITLGEEEIIACSPCVAQRPLWFHDLQGVTHTLTVAHRRGQWLPGQGDFLMAAGSWYGKEIHISLGLELPNGEVGWIKQYVGRIRDIREIAAGNNNPQQAKIYSTQLVYDVLKQMIGGPAADGTRRPFLAGTYKMRAELAASTPPQVGVVQKSGSGSATLAISGVPRNSQDLNFLIEAESTGEVSVATYRWSLDGGSSWEKTGVVSATSANPCYLRDGLLLSFVPGAGDDLVAGDRFSFTAYARRNRYVIPGAPFLAMTNVSCNGVELADAVCDASTGEILLVGQSGVVEARVVKSGLSNPVDIIEEILREVGLAEHIDQVSFRNARQAVADYQIGVKFEGVPAWKAIQTICTTCLLFFWIEADCILVEAYTGEK